MAGYTCGGEQQMRAIGRALMSRPKMILLDETSMGLAPPLIGSIFETVKRLHEEERVPFMTAEQYPKVALRDARYGSSLESGRVALVGDGSEKRRVRKEGER